MSEDNLQQTGNQSDNTPPPAPAAPVRNVAPAAPAPTPTAPVTVGSVQSGLQLALADAKALLTQALADAGTNTAARKAAQAAYTAQVKAINKALAGK